MRDHNVPLLMHNCIVIYKLVPFTNHIYIAYKKKEYPLNRKGEYLSNRFIYGVSHTIILVSIYS